jgi:hypothetical protein
VTLGAEGVQATEVIARKTVITKTRTVASNHSRVADARGKRRLDRSDIAKYTDEAS